MSERQASLPRGCGVWIAWGENGGWGYVWRRGFRHLSMGRLAVGYLGYDVDILVSKGLETQLGLKEDS